MSIKYTLNIDNRIVAVRKGPWGPTGTVGGFIHDEASLSHAGKCWLYDDSAMFGESYIEEDATMHDNSRIMGKASLHSRASVHDWASLYDQASMWDKTTIKGDAALFGKSSMTGYSCMYEKATLYNSANLRNRACLKGTASLRDNAILKDDALVREDTILTGNTVLGKSAYINSNREFFTLTSIGVLRKNIVCYKNSESSWLFSYGKWVGSLEDLKIKLTFFTREYTYDSLEVKLELEYLNRVFTSLRILTRGF